MFLGQRARRGSASSTGTRCRRARDELLERFELDIDPETRRWASSASASSSSSRSRAPRQERACSSSTSRPRRSPSTRSSVLLDISCATCAPRRHLHLHLAQAGGGVRDRRPHHRAARRRRRIVTPARGATHQADSHPPHGRAATIDDLFPRRAARPARPLLAVEELIVRRGRGGAAGPARHHASRCAPARCSASAA